MGVGAWEGEPENKSVPVSAVAAWPLPWLYLSSDTCLPSLPIAPLLASRLPGAALISDIDKLLTELPSSEAQQLRKDAASIIAAVGAQRSAVEKAMQQVGKY